ncbi:MAG TPA: Hsp20/alpha crystallin family protein [Hyphomicrobiaceae bacterium]|nr:Hsp20/alpha crystallin family protein [Hyphomicrobiaceae bacterium]
MPKTEIAKSSETAVSRPRDLFAAMRDEMDRVFEDFEREWPHWPRQWPRLPSAFRRTTAAELVVPDFDVHENAKSIMIEAELPGVDEKDVSITLSGGLLTIKGEKKQEREEKGETHYLCERSFGAFERSLRLPETIDESKLDARFDKGVLRITAAKKPEAVKAERKIEIKKA